MDHQAFAQLLGNYGEFVGAIAVVVTLVYLAVQVKHSRAATEANTKQLESASLRAMTDRLERRNTLGVTNDNFTELWQLILNDSEPRTEIERTRLLFFVSASAVDVEEAWRQHELGTLPQAALRSRVGLLQMMVGTSAGSKAWEFVRRFPDPDFLQWFDTQPAAAQEPQADLPG